MNKMISTSIEILGKPYVIKCPEAEIKSLEQAADFLNEKMLEVKNSGKAINLERIAIITALNIAYEFLQVNKQKTHFMSKINQHISYLHEKMDTAMNKSLQGELLYTAE